ncbi:TraE/TraK family type IV conjugative transfer system protein [Xenorhabdus sp. TH1]|uniref:TraE/TraK family type IV conjugative transfer system protein n=1 Tax=Xenorhabdus sp. TH1 TaxID=3130166 RepID=UPI0030D01D3D
MKFSKLRNTLSGLRETNNTLTITNLCTAIVSIVLIVLVFTKNERVVIVPPNLTTTSWIDNNEGSTAYMQSWAGYIATLLGNANPTSVKFIKESLEPFLAPTNRGAIMQTIDDEIGKIKRDRVSVSFSPTKISSDPMAKGVYFVEGTQEIKSITGKKTAYSVTYIVTVFIKGYKPVVDNIRLKNGGVELPSNEAKKHEGKIVEGSEAEQIVKGSRIND